MSALTPQQKLASLRLIRSENVGPITFYKLIERYGSPEKALSELPRLAEKGGRKKAIKVCSEKDAKKEIEKTKEAGATLIYRGDAHYPPLLGTVEDAPPVISAMGHSHLLAKKSVAIVGARNASMNGCKFAAQLARDLGEGGMCVVSGLARGVDGAAHAAALDNGTVGVQGGGVDVIYPKENGPLYQEMCARACVIAESPLTTQPQARHFPRRNRIISGMSRAIIVIEASPRSGSLITARMALEQGREVFAVPGSPLDPRSQGANGLIKQGANLVENAQDILTALAHMPTNQLEEKKKIFSDDQKSLKISENELVDGRSKIVESLSPSPVFIDEIIRQCHISPTVVQTILLELELAGHLERHPGNMVSLLV